MFKRRFDSNATMTDVRAAYRLLLRREPDKGGEHHYRELCNKGLSLRDLADKFLSSEEFRVLSQRLTAVQFDGFVVCVDALERDLGEEIVRSKNWEVHLTHWVRKHFGAGQTFIDIGANVGCMSLLAATIAGPSGRVIAVEPNPSNVQRLLAGISINRFDNIHVLPFGASDRRSVFSLDGGTSDTFLTEAKRFDAGAIYAQTIVLDEELANIPKIDFVKIDIEGHEPRAIAGFTKLIRKHDPILLTEYSPHCLRDNLGDDPMNYLDQLLSLYQYVISVSPFEVTPPFTDPQSVWEYWQEQDRVLTASGERAPGMFHLDLVASNHLLEPV